MSRKNRYRKNILTQESCAIWGPRLSPHIQTLYENYKKGHLTPPEFCGEYLLVFLKELYSNQYIAQRFTDFPLQLQKPSHLLKPWTEYGWRGIKLACHRSLIEWANGNYPLLLYHTVPTPLEVLKIQSFGKRCVTAIVDPYELSKWVVNERDPWSFLIHDLIHADQFYYRNNTNQAQKILCYLFYKAYQEELWAPYFKNPDIKQNLEYIFSDMNAHPIHLLKVLKSRIEDHPFFIHWKSQFLELCHSLGVNTEWIPLFLQLNSEAENQNIHIKITQILSDIQIRQKMS